MSRFRHGFTLIELLLVLVILAVLAAVVVPRFTRRGEDAKIKAAGQDIVNISLALKMFEVDNGRFPTSEEGVRALVEQPGNVTNWKGPYLDKGMPTDPWSHPYVYRFPGSHNNDFDLYSCGPSGQDGGSDNISNWSENK